jgi:hypothetical protein
MWYDPRKTTKDHKKQKPPVYQGDILMDDWLNEEMIMEANDE